MTYRLNPGSLAALVVGYFTLNPKEELSLDDVITKFVQPGDSRNVHTQLAPALDHELLDYDAKTGYYRLGTIPMPSVLDSDPLEPKRPVVIHRRPGVPVVQPEPAAAAVQAPAAPKAKQVRMDWSEQERALLADCRMVLCPTCGNKRCPHANDHRNACTSSNAPGQPGSSYPAQSTS